MGGYVQDKNKGARRCALPIRKHRGAREKWYSLRVMPFLSFLPCRKDFVHFQDTDSLIVNIDLLLAILALQVDGGVNDNLFHKLMQDAGHQLRHLRLLTDNG